MYREHDVVAAYMTDYMLYFDKIPTHCCVKVINYVCYTFHRKIQKDTKNDNRNFLADEVEMKINNCE